MQCSTVAVNFFYVASFDLVLILNNQWGGAMRLTIIKKCFLCHRLLLYTVIYVCFKKVFRVDTL